MIKATLAASPPPDARRITEADPDFVCLRDATARRLTASVRAFVRDLRERHDAEHPAVQSAFIQRHIALLRDAYAAGHAEGARDYYDTVSLQPAKWARRLAPAVDERRLRERLGFYAPSVAKLAHEARMAWQQSVAQQAATQAARRAERAQKLAEGADGPYDDLDGYIATLSTEERRELEVADVALDAALARGTSIVTDADFAYAQRITLAAADAAEADGDPLDAWFVGVRGRIGLQAEIAWPGLMDGYVRAGVMDPAAPFSLVWWVLGAVETRHCADCPRYAANGPYNAPGSGGNELRATPGDGTTECGAGCKCTLEYVPGGAIEHTVWSVLVPQIEERLASGVATTGGVPEADLVRGPDGTVTGWLVRDASGQVVARMAGNPADLEREEAEGQRLPPGEAERRASAWGEITDTMARLRGVDIQPPALNRLDDAEKAALDRYRAATERWERARVGSPLPELPPLFADLHEIDPTGILSGTVAWEQLTAEQQAALQDVWQALAAWVEAEGDAGVGGHDVAGDPWAESGATGMFSDGEQGTYLLTGGHPKGYEQNRTRDGKFAPGDGPNEHEHASGGHAGGSGGGSGGHAPSGGSGNFEEIKAHAARGVHSSDEAIDLGVKVRDHIHGRMGEQYTRLAAAHARLDDIPRLEREATDLEHAGNERAADRKLMERERILAEYNDAVTGYDRALPEATRAALGEIRLLGGTPLMARNVNDLDPEARVALRSVETMARTLPRQWIEHSNRDGGLWVDSFVDRARAGNYEGGKDGAGIIRIMTDRQTLPEIETVAVHELGHRFEHRVPGLWQIEEQFYTRRTDSEATVEHSQMPGVNVKRDRWVNEYMGRLYQARMTGPGGSPQRSFELLSVGQEWLFGHTLGSRPNLLKDPEYHAFILGLLAGA